MVGIAGKSPLALAPPFRTLHQRYRVESLQEALAEGIVTIAVARMTSAIREISIQRGHDPRDFTLIAFGGAGPMHALAMADEIGIPRVLVPRHPGNFSALAIGARQGFRRRTAAQSAGLPNLRRALHRNSGEAAVRAVSHDLGNVLRRRQMLGAAC